MILEFLVKLLFILPSCSFNLIYCLYSSNPFDLYSGIGSASARVAALLAPFISDALTLSPVIPYIAVGKASLFTVFVTFSFTKSKSFSKTVRGLLNHKLFY